MAVIKKDGNVMNLPMSIERNNPIPLDSTQLWYSYAAMAQYAATGVTAYVGQILGLVDETLGGAKAYIITDVAGTLQEVGAAVLVDEASIALSDDGVLMMKNWGVQYYKYISATEDVEAHYELQQVDEDNEWKIGLEPKVASENGKLVLAWYEPNPTTVEGLNSQIATLQTSVDDLAKQVEDTYNKKETDDAIATAIANAPHLRRQVVNSKDDVIEDNVIYMVPTGLQEDDDKYDEYMLINGIVEKVGSWEVDLTSYAKTEDVNAALAKKVDANENARLMTNDEGTKLAGIQEGAEKNYISSVGSEFNVSDRGKLTLVSVPSSLDLSSHPTLIGLKETIDDKVTIVPGSSLVEDTLIQKLRDMNANGEANFIASVAEDEFKVEDRKLSIVSIDGTKLNLETNTSFTSLRTTVNSHVNALTSLNASIESINNSLDDVYDRLTWHDLPEVQ